MSDKDDAWNSEVARHFEKLWVEFLSAGDWVAGGPIVVAGWYANPLCDPGCCRPYGPFASRLEAEGWCRRVAAAYRTGRAAEGDRLLAAARAA